MSTKAPDQPSDGNVYLYDMRDNENDVLSDQYIWSKISSKTLIVSGVKLLRETYYINRRKLRNVGFQRLVFTLVDGPVNYILVQYVGNESLFSPPYEIQHSHSTDEEESAFANVVVELEVM